MSQFEPNKEMLNNYIQNKLNPTDTEQLELWLLDHPDVMQDLELDIMLKQGVTKQSFAENNKKTFSFLDFFTSRKLIPLHLLAYGLVGFLLFNTLNPKQITQNSVAAFIELEKQRGLDTSIIEVQVEKNKSIVLRLFPDSMSKKYSLTMQSKDSDKTIEFKNLQADDFGSITVTLNNTKNLNGKWEVLLVDSTSKQEQNYLININKL